MGLHKLFPAFLVIGGALCWVQLAGAQNGCTNPPCAPNTVPCAHCTGTWTDEEFGSVYVVTQLPNSNPTTPGIYNVSGTNTWNFPDGCTYAYDILGTIHQNPQGEPLGTTELHWTMTFLSTNCPGGSEAPYEFHGTMVNNSCDHARGVYYEPETQYTLPMTISKPADIPGPPDPPPTETSASTAWADDPTVRLFQGTIQASKSFAGRQVYEIENPAYTVPPTSPNFDGCWFSMSFYTPYRLTKGGWFVGYPNNPNFGDDYGDDRVGPSNAAVNYYRSENQVPCGAAVGQDMALYVQGTSDFDVYKQNVLGYTIGHTTVTVTRDGQSAMRDWGITTLALPSAEQGWIYSFQLTAVLETTPYNWTILFPGELPAGLELTMDGIIHGQPTTTGTTSFTVLVTDAASFAATRYFSLTVFPPLSLPGQLTSF